MGTPFKMRGSPFQRNFGIGSPVKQAPDKKEFIADHVNPTVNLTKKQTGPVEDDSGGADFTNNKKTNVVTNNKEMPNLPKKVPVKPHGQLRPVITSPDQLPPNFRSKRGVKNNDRFPEIKPLLNDKTTVVRNNPHIKVKPENKNKKTQFAKDFPILNEVKNQGIVLVKNRIKNYQKVGNSIYDYFTEKK